MISPILVLGGTADGRAVTDALLARGEAVIYSSVSGMNAPDPGDWPQFTNQVGAMDGQEMATLLEKHAVRLCVDATHPYAKAVSQTAMAACGDQGVDYLRLERPGLCKRREDVRFFKDYDEMVAYLKDHPGNILTTTGSRELGHYAPLPKERLRLRVLPTSGVLAKCEELGYTAAQIIAMQGPFTLEMNVAMLRQFDIRYLTTKDSGSLGGVAQKVDAALECGAEVLCVARPGLDYPRVCETPEQVLDYIINGEETV